MIPRSEVAALCEKIRAQGKRIVFTNGCFDILHRGHVTYLQQAKELGDYLFVGLNSDSSVRKLKGDSRPVQREEDRGAILEALKSVNGVSVFDEDTPLNLIKLVKPDVLVKGGDWAVDKIVGSAFVMSYGGKVFSLPFVPGHSTTGLVEKIQKL